MKLKSISILILLCSAVLGLRAQQIETISVHSDVMNCDIPNIVILPADYDSTSVSYPVLYLLHGYNNDHNAWLRFYQVNERLHEEMLYRHIKHDYITRPGGHDDAYWNNSINYQILFFANYFAATNKAHQNG